MPEVTLINHIIGTVLIIFFACALGTADLFGFAILMDPKHSDNFGVIGFFVLVAINVAAVVGFYEVIKPLIIS